MYEGITGGIIGGIISPLIVSFIQHKWIWKSQKRLEAKFNIYKDAIRALSLLARDALDPKLQSNPSEYNGVRRQVELTPETVEYLEKSKGLIQSFFSNEIVLAFDKAIKSKISIENLPNEDFYANFSEAATKLGKEIGLS